MTITERAKAIHENAVNHGFWERKPSVGEVIALIHSELSEALEEARENKPMIYVDINGEVIQNAHYFADHKPEGIAVELADAVIRVLDFCAFVGIPLDRYDGALDALREREYFDEPAEEVAFLHSIVTDIYNEFFESGKNLVDTILVFVACIELYLRTQNINLWNVVDIKCAYNKGRPYMHNKAF